MNPRQRRDTHRRVRAGRHHFWPILGPVVRSSVTPDMTDEQAVEVMRAKALVLIEQMRPAFGVAPRKRKNRLAR